MTTTMIFPAGINDRSSGDSTPDEAVGEVERTVGLRIASTAALRANMRLAQ